MTQQEFDQVLDSRIAAMRQVLAGKAEEYASGEDRLHNFKVAAKLAANPESPEQALWGMLRKHLVSVIDIIDGTGRGGYSSRAKIDEKIGDAINYLVLLEALLIERETSLKVSIT